MNKKGNAFILIGFIVFACAIMAIILVGAILIAGGNVLWGEVTDAVDDIGMIDDANVTDYSRMSFGVVETMLGQARWLSGICIAIMLIGIIIFASAIRFNPNPLWIGAFIIMSILLIVLSVFVSNMYEDIYNANDDIGSELRSMTMTSWLIINLPNILTVLTFIGGVIMFSGLSSGGEYV